jgi:hypothetical protein
MVRRVFLAVLVLGLVAAVVAGWLLVTEEADHEPPQQERAAVVGAAEDGWQQLSYRGVRLEVPPGWTRMDGDCEFAAEHWGPPELAPCSTDVGVWFYASATFDPGEGPGVHPVDPSDGLPDGGFGGYVTPGDLAVYAQDLDEEVVRRVLRSARRPAAA